MRSRLAAIMCVVVLAIPLRASTSRAFTYVRKEIHSLTPAELDDFRAVVKAIKARGIGNRKSYAFQANIHGHTGAGTDPLWDQCVHTLPGFLAWHRAYLLYFEQMLRQVSNRSDFALPYWDYDRFPSLPDAFRTPADPSNPLWVPGRNPDLAAGGAMDPAVTDASMAMNETSFLTSGSGPGFEAMVQQTPHNAVHGTIGGLMGSVPTASQDPIFWLHHCNIDRLWSKWLTLGGGRYNPPMNSPLGNTVWSFADANNATITIRARDVFCLEDMGYRYDDHTPVLCRTIRWPPRPWIVSGVIAHAERIQLADTLSRTHLPLSPEQVSRLRPAFAPQSTARVILHVRGIRYAHRPTGVYMVFVNPNREPLTIKSASYVGNVTFFEQGHQEMRVPDQEFDITSALRRSRNLQSLRSEGIRVVFRPAGVVARTPHTPEPVEFGALDIQTRTAR